MKIKYFKFFYGLLPVFALGCHNRYAPTPAVAGLQTVSAGVDMAKNATRTVEKNGGDPARLNGDKWTPKTPMPTARRYPASGVIGGKLYIVGGFNGSNLNVNEAYDPASDTWSTKAAMPTGRLGPAAGVIGGKLYVVGGNNGSNLNVNEEYDPEADTWSAKAAMPTARYYLAAGVINSRLYAVGGTINDHNSLNTNEEYDPKSDTWSTKALMPTARFALSAGVFSGKLYAVGGLSFEDRLNANEEYNPATDTWSAKAPMPRGRDSLSAGVIGGKLYVAGGYNPSAGTVNTNEEYDPAANTWSTKAAMPAVRHGLSIGAIGGKLYAVGGYFGAYLNTNAEYDPGVAAKARNPGGVKTDESHPVPARTPAAGPVFAQKEAGKMAGGANVAVAEFTGKNVSQADASIVSDFLRIELVNTGLFNVMDRNNMDSVLAEQKFQNSGCTEQQCAVEMGQLLNVEQMLVGSLSKLLDTYYITASVVDVETGKITASYDADAATSRELRSACKKIVKKISRK